MPTYNIRIKKGHPDSHTLELSDRGRRTWVEDGDTVRWHIDQNSGVKKIEKIEKKGDLTVPEIFVPGHPQEQDDPQQQGKKIWTGDIKSNPPSCAEWEYLIFWIDTNGISHEYDPKISVRPSTGLNLFTKVVLTVVATFLGFRLIEFWRKEKSKR